MKLRIQVTHQIKYFLKLFTQQVIGSWNTSPDEVVTANNIQSFESKLNECWKLKGYGNAERLTAYCYLLSSQTAGYRITQCTGLTCNT